MLSPGKQLDKPSRAKWRLITGASFVLVALAVIGSVAYVCKGDATTHTSAATHQQAGSNATISPQDVAYLEQALSSGTVEGQRRALALELRPSLTQPMFPMSVNGTPTTVTIDPASFKLDTEDQTAATVRAVLSNNQGTYTLRLIHEEHKWLLVYTTEVNK